MANEGSYIEFGRRLRKARQDAGLTQDELGRLVGATGSEMSRYELGKAWPTQKIWKLAEWMGLNRDEIIRLRMAGEFSRDQGRQNGPASQEETGVAEQAAELSQETALTIEDVRALRRLLERLEGTG